MNGPNQDNNPTILSFVGRNLVGVAAANRILQQVTLEKEHLKAPLNALGNAGTVALVRGLEAKRLLFSNDVPTKQWGLVEINVADNDIGDEGLLNAIKYASDDHKMRMMYVQSNKITLGGGVDEFVEHLDRSHLNVLVLANNVLLSTAAIRLFETINAPHLHNLCLASCRLVPSCVPAIAEFLLSPRAKNLRELQLQENYLGRDGMKTIIDAIDKGNFTLEKVLLYENNRDEPEEETEEGGDEVPVPQAIPFVAQPIQQAPAAAPQAPAVEAPANANEPTDGDVEPQAPRRRESYVLNTFSEHESFDPLLRRLQGLLYRNNNLADRVREAAARSIVPARIIIHGRTPTPSEAAKMRPVGSPEPFPLLSLPPEVQLLVARYASLDASAFSHAQWARVVNHAADRSTIADNAQLIAEAQWTAKLKTRSRTGCALDVWCTRLQCNKWELDHPV
ncbi:hypothetical protein Q8F55_005838 [Vanrija albida]|uniref:RNI-like protein n=1 Tax=Vanrija albida TaxID=181172 RepID=A0ABR3Q2P4_9TREE